MHTIIPGANILPDKRRLLRVICRLCHYMAGRCLAEMADGRTNVRYPHGRGPVAGPSFRPGPGRAGRGREGLAGGGNHGPFRLMEIVGSDG